MLEERNAVLLYRVKQGLKELLLSLPKSLGERTKGVSRLKTGKSYIELFRLDTS